jgi:DNA-binding MarR family transcriptional regulator
MPRIRSDHRPIREPIAVSEPGQDVGLALRQLMHTLRQNVESALRARGIELSFVHGLVLKNLAREPGLSGAQVARRAMVTAQTMNGLLRSMESASLIVREPHPENRRRDCWFLTPNGVRQMNEAHEVVDQVLGRMLAPLSRADAARLTALLRDCTEALQASGATKAGPASLRARPHLEV